ncbi:MAG: platelet-activating factor acetylhydrolase IB subunit [Isosphaeraceae bacterium]
MRMRKTLLWRSVLLGSAVLCLLACGRPALAQAPSTVIPASREGWWMKLHESFLDRAKKGHVDLLFLGDSITQGWHDNDVWKRFYEPRHAANFGIGGDQTQHVLWRIRHGELDGIHPRVVVLMIGTNNVGSNSADEIAQGITAIIKDLRQKLPETRILLLGVFPRGEKPNPGREKLEEVNRQIRGLDDGSHVTYLDIGKAFLNPDGSISHEIMPDFLHLTARGYRIWADAMEPTLWRLLDEPASKK